MKHCSWTDYELWLIRDAYPRYGGKFTWRLFNTLGLERTYKAINAKAKVLGLQVPEHMRSFQKGHTPWQKGKKIIGMPRNAGMYKKGEQPANNPELPVGTIRKRAHKGRTEYWWIKVAMREDCDRWWESWKQLHRYIWEEHHGPIPRGMCVTFKNGDQDDVRIENLKLITRSENARRNYNPEKAVRTMGSQDLSDKYVSVILSRGTPYTWQHFMPQKDLIELKRQELLIKRQLKVS